MICHSFELFKAPAANKETTSIRLLAESKRFDAATKRATTLADGEVRKTALLALEQLPEFQINHPTVEVSTLSSFRSTLH